MASHVEAAFLRRIADYMANHVEPQAAREGIRIARRQP
jgi:hypothetical protein